MFDGERMAVNDLAVAEVPVLVADVAGRFWGSLGVCLLDSVRFKGMNGSIWEMRGWLFFLFFGGA